ncbi:PaaI family thioesterase [Palleronia abyssalis]|uniref:Thioesterase domain-containing protein n=1 Tax=Palleronia abyssalis TaxID=1501240 RepID=A0A2R8BUD8_9RHOB|nr:PaaI family thioesterase [Palleronia abyssalis]SPJ23784.1 hypothetical protein PAA8504_01599 [Palleronia abyssalis]
MFARTPEDLPDMATMRSMSGFAFMRAMLEGRFSEPPIAEGINYRLDTVEDGRVVFRGTPKFDHVNPMGGLHGGWYGTLLDSCMACAVMTKVPQGSTYTTLEYKINICRALPPGVEVLAEGRTSHAGRSTGIASGELRGAADGKLYATGSTTCLIMQLPEA